MTDKKVDLSLPKSCNLALVLSYDNWQIVQKEKILYDRQLLVKEKVKETGRKKALKDYIFENNNRLFFLEKQFLQHLYN